MSRFKEISIEWNYLVNDIYKYIFNEYDIEYFIKKIKKLVREAQKELNEDNTIVNKEIEWDTNGFGFNTIYIISIIEFGISKGFDMNRIIMMFNVNNTIEKINDIYTIHDYIIDIYDFYQIDDMNIPDID